MHEAMEVILKRRSVRAFTSQTVPDDIWEKLFRAAMAAPSAVDRRPWEFVLVRGHRELEALAAVLPFAKMAAQSAGTVVACAVPSRAFGASRDFAIIDTSLACENLLLAAEALGLGAVWTAVYPDAARQEAVRALLGIPADVLPLAAIPVGHPATSVAPKEKFDHHRIHEGRW